MGASIFVNLPVKELQRTISFFSGLGYSFDPRFADEKGCCLVVADTIRIMFLQEEYFKNFTQLEVADTSKVNEVILNLSVGSRQEVDTIVEQAVKSGAVEPRPAKDYGFMYSRAFSDLDGHKWAIISMNQ